MKTLKKDFLESTKAKIADWDGRLAALKTRAHQAAGEERAQLDKQVDELSMRQGSARQYLWELSSKEGGPWAVIDAATTKRWSEFTGSVEAMWKQVS